MNYAPIHSMSKRNHGRNPWIMGEPWLVSIISPWLHERKPEVRWWTIPNSNLKIAIELASLAGLAVFPTKMKAKYGLVGSISQSMKIDNLLAHLETTNWWTQHVTTFRHWNINNISSKNKGCWWVLFRPQNDSPREIIESNGINMKHLRNHQFITDDRWLNPKNFWLNLPCLMKSSFLLLKFPWWNEIPRFSWWNLGTLW